MLARVWLQCVAPQTQRAPIEWNNSGLAAVNTQRVWRFAVFDGTRDTCARSCGQSVDSVWWTCSVIGGADPFHFSPNVMGFERSLQLQLNGRSGDFESIEISCQLVNSSEEALRILSALNQFWRAALNSTTFFVRKFFSRAFRRRQVSPLTVNDFCRKQTMKCRKRLEEPELLRRPLPAAQRKHTRVQESQECHALA